MKYSIKYNPKSYTYELSCWKGSYEYNHKYFNKSFGRYIIS